MTILWLVDSLPALARAREESPAARLVTDNPLLAADPATDGAVENIDGLLSQDDANALGGLALDISADLDRRLDTPGIAGRFDLFPGYVRIGQHTSRLLASLLHRGAVLARALATYRPDEIVIGTIEAPRWSAESPFLMPRFASPARALAEDGFFDDLQVLFRPTAAPLPATINDTAIGDYGRRLAMMPLPLLAYEFWRRLPGAASPGRDGRRLVVGQENDAVRETLPWLRLNGMRLEHRGKLVDLPGTAAPGFDERAEPDTAVAGLVDGALRRSLERSGAFDAARTRAIVTLVARHVSAGLTRLTAQTRLIGCRVDEWFGADGGILVTNGLFGPAGAQALGICRARGVRVVEFEHGVTAGLSALTDRKLRLADDARADLHLVCSDRAAAAFADASDKPGQSVLTIGLPDQVRTLLRPGLQRRLARKHLGLGRRETVVMHVSTLPCFGNLRPGLSAPTETTTFELDRGLIEQAYPRLPHRVVFKQYPTQRFPHEPDYGRIFAAADNLRFAKDEDFRYIRAAADVIVTMTPTSTLGWCAGAGVPMVWLDSRKINPLTSEAVRKAFRDAFLFVDIDEECWPDRLVGLLDRDLRAIQAEWRSRATARRRLYREAIAGPPGSVGRRAARIVSRLARERHGTAPAIRTADRGQPETHVET